MANNNLINIIYISLGLATVVFIVLGALVLTKGSQQNLELIRPILGGIGVAWFFLIASLFSPLADVHYKTKIFLLARDKGEIIPFEYFTARYFPVANSSGCMHINGEALSFSNSVSKKEESSLNIVNSDYFLDLAEWATFTWIIKNYPHWQAEREWSDGLSGGGGAIWVPDTAYKKTERIDLVSLLKENVFAEKKKEQGGQIYICLPEGTKASYKRMHDLYHKVVFENDNIILEILFMHNGGGAVGASKLAEKIQQEARETLEGHRISIVYNVRVKRVYRWSKLTAEQLAWVEVLYKLYNESFSWEVYRDRLEKVFYYVKI